MKVSAIKACATVRDTRPESCATLATSVPTPGVSWTLRYAARNFEFSQIRSRSPNTVPLRFTFAFGGGGTGKRRRAEVIAASKL